MAVDSARAKSLFLAASDLADPTERAAYLERECGGDAELRERVEALLRANDAAPLPPASEATVDSVDGPPGTSDYGDATARVGDVLAGRYKLVEEIGAGGMGTVFMARQTEPVKRVVAVKVVKAGMDSKAILARFDAERQALAMMDHPNIAKVLDAGTTGQSSRHTPCAVAADGTRSVPATLGRPFFVMELVKGVPITEYCDARKLTPKERLELFVPVCQAIQHAHQKGVIHRDIKPSNVLIALYDDRAVPKVIDFGVAKATGASLTDLSLMTGFGAIVGTPEYMSPEQASLNNLDIDTRSDVYALGVLLYELLTGTTPVDRKSLKEGALLEILRIVREVETPRPSAKLSTIDTLANVAANRSTEPARLSMLMKGELDWVVLKALEKDRSRRYETANALARDIQRYLDDEVVEARPPSAAYRLKKVLKRHKGPAIACALVLLALIVGIGGTTFGLIEAKRQEELAEERRQEAVTARNDEAKRAEGEATERQRAQNAERKAIKAEEETRKKADELKHQLGVSHMILANTAFDQNDMQLTAEWLNKIPPAQQGWSWRYLKQQSQGGLFTLRGHRFGISHVAYSPDGKLIVTAGGTSGSGVNYTQAAEVNVWDARTGKLLLALEDVPRSTVGRMSVAFSPDGRKIVTAGAETRKRVRLPNNTFRSEVVSSPLKVWDAQTGKLLLELREGIEQWIASVAFTPDGKRFATGAYSEGDVTPTSVQIWAAEQASKPLLELPGMSSVYSLAFSPDGKRLVTLESGTVKIWDAEKGGKPLLDLKGGGGNTVSFSPDGKRIVTGHRDATAVVRDAETGEIKLRLKGQFRGAKSGAFKPHFECAAFSPDGSRVVTGGGTDEDFTGQSARRGDIAIWNARTGELLHQFRGHHGLVTSVSFSPDGEQILTGSSDHTAKVWDARTGSGRITWKGHTNSVLSVAVSPDGSRIVTGAGDMKSAMDIRYAPQVRGEATLWDARTGKSLVKLKDFKGSVNSVAFSPDGERFVTAGFGPRVKIDAPAERRVALGDSISFRHSGVATVWDAQSGKSLVELKGFERGVNSVAFSQDGRRIVTVGFEDWFQGAIPQKGTEVKVWDATTGKLVHDLTDQTLTKFPGIPSDLRGGCVAFSPDGRWIVAGAVRRPKNYQRGSMFHWAHLVSVWDAQTGQHVRDIKGSTGRVVTSVAFSPEGTLLATGCTDRTAKIWNFQTGELLIELKGHQGAVTSVAFSPEGRQIITGSKDGTVRVWDVKTGTALAVLQGRMANVTSVAFCRDGKTIVAGGGKIGQPGNVMVWKPHLDPDPEYGVLTEVESFSPDDSRFLVQWNGAKVCDARTGSTICTLQSAPRLGDFGFSPDGERVIAAENRGIFGADRVVRRLGKVIVWTAKTGKVVLTLNDIKDGVKQVAYSLDGRRIVTFSETADGRKTRVWDSQSGKEMMGEPLPRLVPHRKQRADGAHLVGVDGETFKLVSTKPDPAEAAYRHFCTRPKPERYRENYLAARLAKAASPAQTAENEFAARYYLNLIPAGEREALVAEGDAALAASLAERARKLRRSASTSQAVPVLMRVLEIQNRIFGPDQLETLKTMTLLGLVYRQTNQIDKSIEVFKKLLKLSEAKHGRNHLQTMQAIAQLGANYAKSDDKEQQKKAIPLLEEAHRSIKEFPQLGTEDPEAKYHGAMLPWVSLQLLRVLAKTGETKKMAQPIAELSERIRTKHPDNPLMQTIWFSSLAESLLKFDAIPEAEKVLRVCLTMLKEQKNNQRNRYGRDQLARIVEQLARKYEAVGKKDTAARWRKELQAMKQPVPAKKAGGK